MIKSLAEDDAIVKIVGSQDEQKNELEGVTVRVKFTGLSGVKLSSIEGREAIIDLASIPDTPEDQVYARFIESPEAKAKRVTIGKTVDELKSLSAIRQFLVHIEAKSENLNSDFIYQTTVVFIGEEDNYCVNTSVEFTVGEESAEIHIAPTPEVGRHKLITSYFAHKDEFVLQDNMHLLVIQHNDDGSLGQGVWIRPNEN